MLGKGKAQGSQTGFIPVNNPLGVYSQHENLIYCDEQRAK